MRNLNPVFFWKKGEAQNGEKNTDPFYWGRPGKYLCRAIVERGISFIKEGNKQSEISVKWNMSQWSKGTGKPECENWGLSDGFF